MTKKREPAKYEQNGAFAAILKDIMGFTRDSAKMN